MPRGYRCIVLAAVGWLTLANGPQPQVSGQPKQSQAGKSEGNAAGIVATPNGEQAERPKSPPERPPCGPQQYDSNDDLCAQWKAADAADSAAYWTRVSGVLSVAGLLGVAGALVLTVQSNRIARDTAVRQIRAYLSIEPFTWGITDPLKPLRLTVSNSGQSPAYLVNVFSSYFFSTNPKEVKLPPKKRSPLRPGRDHDGSIGPGKTANLLAYDPPPVSPLQAAKIAKKEMALIHYGYMRYFDCFGKERTTEFAFFHWGDDAQKEWRACRWNNKAT